MTSEEFANLDKFENEQLWCSYNQMDAYEIIKHIDKTREPKRHSRQVLTKTYR